VRNKINARTNRIRTSSGMAIVVNSVVISMEFTSWNG
jgi:hypothetical protein